MNPKEYLIEKGLPSWMAKFIVKKIVSLMKEDKYIELNNYLDKPVGGHGKKDVFKGK